MRTTWLGIDRSRSAILLVCAMVLGACADGDPTAVADVSPLSDGGTAAGAMTVIDLGTLGGDATSAFGINNRGTVVGTSRDAGGVQLPFIWTAAGGMRALDVLDGEAGAALAINEAGIVVGWIGGATGGPRAVKWLRDGTAVLLEQMPGTGPGMATAINNAGDIVGWNLSVAAGGWPAGTLWRNDGATERVCASGAWEDMPAGINNSRTIVGGGWLQADAFDTGSPVLHTGYLGYVAHGAGDCRPIRSDTHLAGFVAAVNDGGEMAVHAVEYTMNAHGEALYIDFVQALGARYSADRGFEPVSAIERPYAINHRGDVAGERGLNDAGDRVDGRYLWTQRPRFYNGSLVALGHAGVARASFNSRADVRGCPDAIASLVRAGALPECPVRGLEQRMRGDR